MSRYSSWFSVKRRAVQCSLQRVWDNTERILTRFSTCFLRLCANVKTSGGAETACTKNDSWPSPFCHGCPHTASSGNGSCSRSSNTALNYAAYNANTEQKNMTIQFNQKINTHYNENSMMNKWTPLLIKNFIYKNLKVINCILILYSNAALTNLNFLVKRQHTWQAFPYILNKSENDFWSGSRKPSWSNFSITNLQLRSGTCQMRRSHEQNENSTSVISYYKGSQGHPQDSHVLSLLDGEEHN